jgi:glucose/arabinose dehydrogenase
MRNQSAGARRLLVLVCSLAAGAGLLGADCTPMTRAVRVASGLSSPNYLTAPIGDPRLFVLELGGRVRVVENGALRATPFLDLSGRVAGGGEQGLLGMAFAPDYDDSGEFYVYYIDTAGDSVLSRFLVSAGDPNRADAASERVVLRVDQPAGRTNHKGGTIAFSPADGMLYWALGDGGGSNDPDNLAQNGQSLLGKMLRLDVGGGPASTYTIPPDNPFAGGGDGVRDEIWAFGFRNPFRFSFDATTGDLWVGDVGQGQREEVNFEAVGDPGGRNYGWKVHEGTLCHLPQPGLPCESPAAPDRFTFPIHQYATHVNGTCSITGGVVYRGRRLHSLVGAYLYSDYCSDRVEARRIDGSIVDVSAGMLVDAGRVDGVVAIGEDGFGEPYLVSIASGEVHRLESR